MLFVLLSGYPPFDGENNKEIFKSILKKDLEFDPKEWGNMSDEAKHLIKLMLMKDP